MKGKMKDKDGSSAAPSIPVGEPWSPNGIGALVNSEMCRLSLGERDKVLQDVHGVSDEIEETPEFLSERQSQLDRELSKLEDKDAYELAYSMDPKYVGNPNFRLRFLRADEFDAKQAAIRMARHFEYKLRLFGRELLARDIVQDDLDEEDLDCLYCGFMQLLPARDRAGRAVNIWMPCLKPDQDTTSKMRRLFYATMVHSEDVETQKKGMVSILDTHRMTARHFDRDAAWSLPSFTRACPLKFVGGHICYDNPLILPLAAMGQLACGTFTRLRVRSHYGSHTDMVYNLQTFGIPTYALPFDENGKPDTKQNRIQWEKRRKHERMTHKVDRVIVPGPFDVLLGRGRLCQDNVGNQRYRFMIDQEKERYDKASKTEKTKIAKAIVTKIKELTGRFLKDDDGAGWVLVEDVVARAKIAHCFRSLRAPKAGTVLETTSRKISTRSPVEATAVDSSMNIQSAPAKRSRT